MNKIFSTKDICTIGIFTALICALGQISIPMPYGVPITLQTFAVMLTGIILGRQKGCVSTLIYLLIGAVGLPVFSGFQGGLGVIFGPTGGFILAFPILAYLCGKGYEKNNIIHLIIFVILGNILTYFIGIIVFSLVTGSLISVGLSACVLPFIPTDIIKSLLAILLGKTIKTRLIKSNLL